MDQAKLMEMALLFGGAFLLCLLITPVVRRVALRWGLVDSPDTRRKMHKLPTPVAGGVAVYISGVIALAMGYAWLVYWPEQARDHLPTFLALAAAATVLVVVGVIDDFRGMLGRYKLSGQVLAAGIVVGTSYFGDRPGVLVREVNIFDQNISLGFLAVPFTLFWLLGAINSLNLIDGMDGLLGSLGFILCLTIGGMAYMNGNFAAGCVAVTMAGGLLAFLGFNFPPASIFLGDAGSMVIGLVVGTLAIQASLKGPATVALAAPVALMIIPIVDTSAAIIRRKLTGRSVYTTDRGHLHHVLLGKGMSNRWVLFIVAVLSIVAGAGALISRYKNNEVYALVAAAAVVTFLVVSRLFGYAEFLLIKEKFAALVAGMRHGHTPGRVHQIKVHLQGSADWNAMWRELTRLAEELNLKTLTLDVNAPMLHEQFHSKWERVHDEPAEAPRCWRVEIPLTVGAQAFGRFDVVGLRDAESAWHKLAALAKIVEDIESALQEMLIAKELKPAGPAAVPIGPSEGLQFGRV